MTKARIYLLFGLLLVLVTLSVVGCTGGGSNGMPAASGSGTSQTGLSLASLSAMAQFVQEAPPTVQEAYRFAVANPDVMHKIPCYCGCGAMGHKDNLSCYVKEFRPDGSIEFDNHATGCSICVDITQDVMRLMRQGQDLKSIRGYVDQQYSQYGPSTNTPPVE